MAGSADRRQPSGISHQIERVKDFWGVAHQPQTRNGFWQGHNGAPGQKGAPGPRQK